MKMASVSSDDPTPVSVDAPSPTATSESLDRPSPHSSDCSSSEEIVLCIPSDNPSPLSPASSELSLSDASGVDSEESEFSGCEEAEGDDPGLTQFPLSALTTAHVVEHNRKYRRHAVWRRHLGAVYDARRLFVTLLPMLQACAAEQGMSVREAKQLLRRVKHSRPQRYILHQYVTRQLGIPQDYIAELRAQCVVGKLLVVSEEVQRRDSITQLHTVLRFIQEAGKSEIVIHGSTEYLDAFERQCKETLERLERRFCDNPAPRYTDINRNPYSLPPWFSLDSVRPYLRTYTPLDTRVSGELLARQPVLAPLRQSECDVTFLDALRPWLDGEGCVDTSLGEGEAAWETLPEGVVERDQPTDQQLQLLQQRAHRKALGDVTRMRKTRERHLEYFSRKYKFPNETVSRFVQWFDVMLTNQTALEQLCS